MRADFRFLLAVMISLSGFSAQAQSPASDRSDWIDRDGCLVFGGTQESVEGLFTCRLADTTQADAPQQ